MKPSDIRSVGPHRVLIGYGRDVNYLNTPDNNSIIMLGEVRIPVDVGR